MTVQILPTDTIPGIFCDATNDDEILQIFKIKHRNPSKPFAIFLHNIEQIWQYAEKTEIAEKISNKYLPGQLTLVLKAKNTNISQKLISSDGFIGIRIPNHAQLLKILQESPNPLCATSANLAGEAEATRISDISDVVKSQIQTIVDGTCGGISSTVVKVENNEFRILRFGAVRGIEID